MAFGYVIFLIGSPLFKHVRINRNTDVGANYYDTSYDPLKIKSRDPNGI